MEESRVAVLTALAGNGALAVVKGIVAATTGSAAMLAETFHSIADTGNQALLVLGGRLARRRPDRDHPFGHGKNVYVWAFVVAMMLFTLGGAFSIWEAVRKLRDPGAHEPSMWAFVVLGAGFVFETIPLVVAFRQARRNKGHRSWLRYLRSSRDPTLVTVLLEDSAALISLTVAAGGLALAYRTGNTVWDALASGAIGVLLLGVAIALALENHSLLIGEAAAPGVQRRICQVLADDPAVADLRLLKTMHVGPTDLIEMAKVELQPRDRDLLVEDVIARLEQRLRAELDGDLARTFIAIEPVPAERRRAA